MMIIDNDYGVNVSFLSLKEYDDADQNGLRVGLCFRILIIFFCADGSVGEDGRDGFVFLALSTCQNFWLVSHGYASYNDKKGQCAENVYCSNQQMTITGEPAEPYGGKQI